MWITKSLFFRDFLSFSFRFKTAAQTLNPINSFLLLSPAWKKREGDLAALCFLCDDAILSVSIDTDYVDEMAQQQQQMPASSRVEELTPTPPIVD